MTGQFHRTTTLLLERSPRYQLNSSLSGLQSWSRGFDDKINLLLLQGIEPQFPERTGRNPVIIPKTLIRTPQLMKRF